MERLGQIPTNLLKSMPLTRNDCGFLADTIKKNVKYWSFDETEADKKYWSELAQRFQETYETGIVTD
jgi:hypothetical protein